MKTTILTLAALLVAGSALAADLSVGVNVGANTTGTNSSPVVGVSLAGDANKNLRVEAGYSYDDSNNAHELMGYVMPQARIPTTALTPYLLVGAGVQHKTSDTTAQWAVGAGLRVEVTPRMDVDFRYRRVDTVDNNDKRDVYTAGIAVKF